jgi:hypothetical protein
MKTVYVSLVLCLNIGVDPPDIIKTSPCAKLECWTGLILAVLGFTPCSTSHDLLIVFFWRVLISTMPTFDVPLEFRRRSRSRRVFARLRPYAPLVLLLCAPRSVGFVASEGARNHRQSIAVAVRTLATKGNFRRSF